MTDPRTMIARKYVRAVCRKFWIEIPKAPGTMRFKEGDFTFDELVVKALPRVNRIVGESLSAGIRKRRARP